MLWIIDLQPPSPLNLGLWPGMKIQYTIHPQVKKNKRDNYDLIAKSVCQTSRLDFKHISDTQYHWTCYSTAMHYTIFLKSNQKIQKL